MSSPRPPHDHAAAEHADNLGSTPGPTARQRRLTLAVLSGILVLTLAVHWVYRAKTAEPPPVVREVAVFDTYARLTLWTADSRAAPALDECAAELARIHQALNRFNPGSEVSQLNATAAQAPFVCSPLLWDVVRQARQGYRQTDGAFDITVGPLMALWGFHRRRDTLPTEAEIVATMGRVGLDRVVFDEQKRSVRFTVPGMSLDFGGIAKGFALDRVQAILARHGIDQALVDLGGNVGCTALPPPGRPHFVVGIRNPFAVSTLLGRLAVSGRAVATSGNYERRIVIQGKAIGHIVDPRIGRPISGPSGVTAVTPRGVDSDVFSTAVYVAGPDLARRLVKAVPGTGFALVMGTADDHHIETVGEVPLLDAPSGPAAPAP